jgi:hypothetical protein
MLKRLLLSTTLAVSGLLVSNAAFAQCLVNCGPEYPPFDASADPDDSDTDNYGEVVVPPGEEEEDFDPDTDVAGDYGEEDAPDTPDGPDSTSEGDTSGTGNGNGGSDSDSGGSSDPG